MIVVWALTGIWHGADWNFLLWGLYFGFFIILERLVLKRVLDKMPAAIRHILVILIAIIGFVMFRNESFAAIGQQFKAMFAPWTVPISDPYAVYAVKSNPILLAACIACLLPLRKWAVRRFKERRKKGKKNVLRPYLKAALALSILALSVIFLVGQSFNPFLYFRF